MVVGAFRVGHGREFQLAIVVADNATNGVLIAVLPIAELVRRENPFRGLVAHFHVVHPRRNAGVIDSFDKTVLEHVVVDQASVTHGAVQNPDLGSIRHPRCSH